MEEWKRQGRHRISMDLMNDLYRRVLKHAEKRNVTVTKWISRAILKELIEEEKYEKDS